jgi:hypothetical protein
MRFYLVLHEPATPSLTWRSEIEIDKDLQPGDEFQHEGSRWRVELRAPVSASEVEAELSCVRVGAPDHV